MSTVLYVLAAILMLGVMVTVHEAGHFFAARLTGIPVKEYAIGFGPKILSWKSKKHDTKFFLRLIPAGGYCMFYGEDDTVGREAADPRAIGNYPVWKRFLTVLMGPVMNFVLALVAATVIYASIGEYLNPVYGYIRVQEVFDDSPAQAAGIQAGDVFLTVNGRDAKGLVSDQPDENGLYAYRFSALLSEATAGCAADQDAPLTLGVLRDGETLEIPLAARYDETEGRFLIGVKIGIQYDPGEATPVSLPRAVALGADYCVQAGGAILTGLKELVTTGKGLEESSGPVGIVQTIAEETQRSAAQSSLAGWITYGQLLVLISVNLGLFNLIPIPGLDGSRLIFLLIEAVRRKPVPRKVEAYVHMTGFVLLIGLLVFMTGKDIQRIFR